MDNQTRVKGKVGISPEIIITMIPFGIAGLILATAMLRSLGALVLGAILMGSLFGVIYFGVIHIRTNLINQLCAIFEKPPA